LVTAGADLLFRAGLARLRAMQYPF